MRTLPVVALAQLRGLACGTAKLTDGRRMPVVELEVLVTATAALAALAFGGCGADHTPVVGADLCAEMEAEAAERCDDEGADCFVVGCYESLPPFGSCEPDGIAVVDRRGIRRAGAQCESIDWVMATQDPTRFCEDEPATGVEMKVSCAPDYLL